MGINTVLVTQYDESTPIEGTENLAQRLAATFRTYGIEPSTPAVAAHGRLELADLLLARETWTPSAQGTVVYWLGHGCGQPDRLLHWAAGRAHSNDGILQECWLTTSTESASETGFIIVILEYCRIDNFARALKEKSCAAREHKCPTLFIFSRDAVTVPSCSCRPEQSSS